VNASRPESRNRNLPLAWDFPLKRPHAGILLGNGIQGLMVWGYEGTLCITVSRAGFWDHRHANDCLSRTTYRRLRAMLEAHDEAGVRAAFATDTDLKPIQIGGGRLVIQLPDGWTLTEGTLDGRSATIRLGAEGPASRRVTLTIQQATDEELAWVRFPRGWLARCRWHWVPSWAFVEETLRRRGCTPPVTWSKGHEQGFRQDLPDDPSLTCRAATVKDCLTIRTALGNDAARPANLTATTVKRATARSKRWWTDYWRQAPRIRVPDPVLQEVVDWGLYKLGCTTPPHAPTCALQGPFMEDYQIPPWSNDYHFNINVQMIYQPLLAANHLDHFRPLWAMLEQWMPSLRANGRAFFESDEAIMLPHGVDDRGRVIGSFWTGSIDHGCTAWMAHMAWDYYRYSMDRAFLEKLAWPLLTGAFAGYWAMMEPDESGGLCLPVSVSPEFKGARMDAWGRNASFQLAACHAVVRALREAAPILGRSADPRWERVARELPPYQTIEAPTSLECPERTTRHIALWKGHDLNTSHRHHSHLAGLYPFRTVDPASPEHAEVVQASLRHWAHIGPGSWTGWCVPWAAAIRARCGQADAAVAWLHWWRETFVNEGRGTLHNAAFPGTGLLDIAAPWYRQPVDATVREVMQLDAGMGALSAVFELLVQCRPDGIHVLPAGLPRGWKECAFDGLRTAGAFQVGATARAGQTIEVRVTSLRGGPLHLHPGIAGTWAVNGKPSRIPVLACDTRPGQSFILRPVNGSPGA
jgi:hypothetical protein